MTTIQTNHSASTACCDKCKAELAEGQQAFDTGMRPEFERVKALHGVNTMRQLAQLFIRQVMESAEIGEEDDCVAEGPDQFVFKNRTSGDKMYMSRFWSRNLWLAVGFFNETAEAEEDPAGMD